MNVSKRFQINTFFESSVGRSLSLTLIVFTLVPMLALVMLSAYTIRVELEKRSVAQTQTVADLIQQASGRWITAASDQLASTIANPVTAQNAAFILRPNADASRAEQVLSKEFSALLATHAFSAVYLVRPDGSVVVSTDSTAAGKSLGVDLSQFEQNQQPFWGFDQLPLTGQYAALTAQPVLGPARDVVGFVVGQYDLQNLSKLINENSVSIGQTGEGYLLSNGGHPLTSLRLSASEDAGPFIALLDPEISGVARGQQGGYSGPFSNAKGQSVFGTIQRLQTPLGGWLVVEQQQSETFGILYTVLRAAVVFLLMLALLALAASLLATRRIVMPLQSLAQAAESMARGQFKTRVQLKRRDEFGSLAASFNSMAGEWERTFNSLQNANRGLQHRAEQMDIITRMGQYTASFLQLDPLLNTTVQVIQEAFNYYAVALYLPTSDNKAMEVKAAAGAAASEFMASKVSWPLGGGPVGSAASTRTISIEDINDNNLFKPHPLQPRTQVELSIPLLVDSGRKLIGVLDIQLENLSALSTSDVEVLRILASQIAIAIRNAELFKESEEARQAADEANQQKSEFLSNMSHELRTPLNVIIGYSHSILNRPAMYDNEKLPAVYESAVQAIMSSGQHLLGLITDILDLSKIEAGQIELDVEPADPLSILKGVQATALGLVKKGVQIHADYPTSLPLVMGDELRIRQILLNLVSNAAKFTEQGSITLDTKVQDEKLQFSVADTGIGIPADVQPLLFNRFRQGGADTTRKYGGTGLGLSISRELTIMHGGEIWFESEPGQGTTFNFTIPLVKAETMAPRKTEPKPIWKSEMAPGLSSRVSVFDTEDPEALIQQILLVDTRVETRNALQAVCTEAGYDVFPADGSEGVQTLASALLPDLVVVHLQLDDTAEIAVLPELLRQDKDLSDTPVVTLSDLKPELQSEWSKLVLAQIHSALHPVPVSSNAA